MTNNEAPRFSVTLTSEEPFALEALVEAVQDRTEFLEGRRDLASRSQLRALNGWLGQLEEMVVNNGR